MEANLKMVQLLFKRKKYNIEYDASYIFEIEKNNNNKKI